MTADIVIEKLPFYWRLTPASVATKNVVSDRMPFIFGFDENTGTVIQKRNPAVLNALETVYKEEYNIGYLQDTNEIAKPYGVDFIRYLKSAINLRVGMQKLLEIGCGGCIVLESLKKDGHQVLGIDSSPFAANEGKKKNIPVMTGFFPLTELDDKFDVIFHVDVLEHIANPVEFLKSHAGNLRDDGIVIVNVPDATESIDIGDVSMAMHQHLNYFTETTLKATLECAGLRVESIEKAKYGGSLYATGRKENGKLNFSIDLPGSSRKFEYFQAKAHQNLRAFTEISKSMLLDGHCQLGYYVPLRALPYISAAGFESGFRLFDDTAHWHGCVFDGVDVPIENFEDLKRNPLKNIVIMSLTFGEVIKKKINLEFGESIRVITLSELVDDSAT